MCHVVNWSYPRCDCGHHPSVLVLTLLLAVSCTPDLVAPVPVRAFDS